MDSQCVKVLVAQLCPTLCDPLDCSLPDSSVHGILQTRILKWVAIPFSRGSFWNRDQIQVSCIIGRFLTVWDTREAHIYALLQKPLKYCHKAFCVRYFETKTNDNYSNKVTVNNYYVSDMVSTVHVLIYLIWTITTHSIHFYSQFTDLENKT